MPAADPVVLPVADDEWSVVAWLWQDFRHDLAPVVQGFPYADGRYQHAQLDGYPATGRAGYLAWAAHPKTGEQAPTGFALVDGLDSGRHQLAALFVVPAARRGGRGRRLALEVIALHPGPWEVAFQHDNHDAGQFWRAVATVVWGEAWDEQLVAVPHRDGVPPDHWIRSR